jgi:inosine-uridine nucleoside N-ribohydrolase
MKYLATLALFVGLSALAHAAEPVRIIFDTDIGNDVDDALALGMLHSLQSRGECELLAVTITKDHALAAPFVDAVNTFYGRGRIPIGMVRDGVTPEDSKFLPLATQRDGGKLRYPHNLKDGADAPEATALLREVLAAQPDASVAMVQVGFSSNLARLLDTPADDHSDLSGLDLVKKKVSVLSIMAGAFQPIEGKPYCEYNVVFDLTAAKKLTAEWPTPIVWSGFEIGLAIPYPAASIEQDYRYVAHHILPEAYQLYEPTPHERPTWDLTSALWAVRPNRGYFGLSEPGTVAVAEEGETIFTPSPEGKHRYLTVDALQVAQVKEALVQLCSQPPDGK